MKITIDTDNLSELDLNMLAFLAENGEVAAASEPVETPKPAKPEPKKSEPKKSEPKAEEPAEAPAEEPEEDLVGGEKPKTMSDAITAATELVSSGNAAKVKEALAKVGDVKRVSELKEDQIQKFLKALEG